jgi:hypothetical protein
MGFNDQFALQKSHGPMLAAERTDSSRIGSEQLRSKPYHKWLGANRRQTQGGIKLRFRVTTTLPLGV